MIYISIAIPQVVSNEGMRGAVGIARLTVVSSNPIKDSRCLLRQDTLPSLIITSYRNRFERDF